MEQLPLNRLQSLRDRIPHGVKTLPLFIEGVPKGGGSIYTARDYCFVIASINNTAIDPIAVASQTPPTRARLHRAARDLWLCDWLDGNK